MKKTRHFLLITIIFFFLNTIINQLAFSKVDTEIKLNTGYRLDSLNWNIAGNGVNILSELKWQDLRIFETELKVNMLINQGIYLRMALGFGWILDGKNQDSDYDDQNRSQEYSRSNNKANKGYVFDVSIGGGYQFALIDRKLFITPVFGLAYYSQYLRMTDGYQTIALIPADLGAFDGLNSSYDTHWMSAWIGCDLLYKIGVFTFFLGFEVHGAYYYAIADWNLRDDYQHPKSFAHYAPGIGFDSIVTISITLNKNWFLSIDYHFRHYFTFSGTDQTYMANGDISNTPLNEVNWWSNKIMLGVSCLF